MKKFIILLLFLPVALQAATNGKNNTEIAKECIALKNAILPILNAQTNEECRLKIDLAKTYIDAAATSILGDNRSLAKDYVQAGAGGLAYAELLDCEQPQNISILKTKADEILNDF